MPPPPPPPFTIAFQAHRNPDKLAVADGARRLSYREFNSRINQAMHLLEGLGLRRGERFAMMLPNCPEFLELCFASEKLKTNRVPVGVHLKHREVEHIVGNSESRALFFAPEFMEVVRRASLPGVSRYVSVGGRAGDAEFYDDLLSRASPEEPLYDSDELTPSITYTSGTTGTPKGVYRAPKKRDIPQLTNIISAFGITSRDIHLIVCPLYHSAPWALGAIHAIFGCTLVLQREFDAEQVLAAIETERVSTAFLVPTQLTRIAALPPEVKKRYRVDSMRALITGAAPCPHATKVQTLQHFGPVLYEFYGSTETGLNTVLRPEEQLAKMGSCGRALPGHEVKILDEEGQEVPPGQVGLLYIRTSVLATAYLKNPEATREGFRDGFFTVGDMAKVDPEGYLYVVDRKSDMVISGGVNIYPAETENVLRSHPAVYDAAVVGVPDLEWGERLSAFVVLRPGQRDAPTAEELIALCRENLADYKRPRRVHFVPELPYSPQGKVMKRLLRERALELEATDAH
ncbi:MAG: AMP-binding protein [Euryarchaeota archaeon]|nr:AMP-binding protein [Euryarchaeota archaeon]